MKRVSPKAAPMPMTTPTIARRMPVPHHQLADAGAVGAERHADADLLGALLH